jgi:hypothetical protein
MFGLRFLTELQQSPRPPPGPVGQAGIPGGRGKNRNKATLGLRMFEYGCTEREAGTVFGAGRGGVVELPWPAHITNKFEWQYKIIVRMNI